MYTDEELQQLYYDMPEQTRFNTEYLPDFLELFGAYTFVHETVIHEWNLVKNNIACFCFNAAKLDKNAYVLPF